MKFFAAVGNPPYMETKEDTSDTPVYNLFMDAAFEVADKVELITPARFLFNAGKTPKSWNDKMLNDEHFKVLQYEADASKVFPNTAINGGVAITYRDANKRYGEIKTFTAFSELNSILSKVTTVASEYVADTVFAPESYKFTDVMHMDFPECENSLSKGHKYDVTSNIFDKLPQIFLAENPGNDEYISMYGREGNQRTVKYIKKIYINGPANLDKYKVILSKADGAAGQIGVPVPARIIGRPSLGIPNMGHTQTFISMGCLSTETEAVNFVKYLKSKFARCMVGVLKVTQDNKKAVWKYVPLQDFTDSSDINWNTSIKNIDKQLYKKYNLTDEEIEFIEAHVKEME